MFGTRHGMKKQFSEVKGTGVYISDARANGNGSMALLQQNGLRPMTYQEAFTLIDRNPELKARLKGKWFYLSGKGLNESEYYTFDDEGRLISSKKGEAEAEKTVYVFKENNMLMYVHTDVGTGSSGWRFCILDSGPKDNANVVVGVKANYTMAMQKIDDSNRVKIGQELVFEQKSVADEIRAFTRNESIGSEINEVANKVLRAIE
jgi:hypothetical protein